MNNLTKPGREIQCQSADRVSKIVHVTSQLLRIKYQGNTRYSGNEAVWAGAIHIRSLTTQLIDCKMKSSISPLAVF